MVSFYYYLFKTVILNLLLLAYPSEETPLCVSECLMKMTMPNLYYIIHTVKILFLW
jgi:hypothetical protein